jgi:cardiolipin synthase (CMP-forming)
MRARDIPNAITVVRILLVLPLLWALMQAKWNLALLLVALAGLSDALDGFLAKRFAWSSELGGILDPIADKTLLLSCFFGLWQWTGFPGWLFGLMLLRDVIIVSGAVVWWRMHKKNFRATPSYLSKITTTVQIFLAVFFLASTAFAWQLHAVMNAVFVVAAALTLASGADYVWRYGRAAATLSKEKQ